MRCAALRFGRAASLAFFTSRASYCTQGGILITGFIILSPCVLHQLTLAALTSDILKGIMPLGPYGSRPLRTLALELARFPAEGVALLLGVPSSCALSAACVGQNGQCLAPF